jgi:radical SAM protein with 4Fe4S-binding SPASM domain
MNNKRFQNLQHLNLILTNACNKKCDYCYEQHSKLYTNFTVDSLKEAYDFLIQANEHEEKYFQFFGGEPLLQKGLILAFLRKYEREFEKHPDVKISMVTNGTLLTDSFIAEYFSHENTQIMISLDSHKSDVEHRHSSEKGVNEILDHCKSIIKVGGDLTIRCTLSRETLPHLEDFLSILKDIGVKSMVIHPLTMSAEQGFIDWSEEEWSELERILKDVIQNDDEFVIHFSEGTGTKSCSSNCMVGDSMIAMDGTGEYSGCYFFTNQKDALPGTILGNLFTGITHEDRYDDFEKSYEKHFARDEKCHTCELENYCYQCPAGNLSTGSKEMFRSDSMCQRIVKLFLTLRRDENHKKFYKLTNKIRDAFKEEGHIVFSRAIYQLVYRLRSGHYIPFESLKRMNLPHYEKLMGFIVSNPEFDIAQDIGLVREKVEAFEGAINSRDFVNLCGKDSGTKNDIYNIALLHFMLSPKKNEEETLEKRLEKQLEKLSK